MEINEILALPTAAEIIQQLKKKDVAVPSWDLLKKQYYQKYHPVMDKTLYPDKSVGRGKSQRVELVTRRTLGWQKLAVKRISGIMFGIPVVRKYKPQNDAEQKVATIMEDIFKKNRINSMNRERAKKLYASCEELTVWYSVEMPTIYGGESTALRLRNMHFSPMDGSLIYPLFDEYGDLIALSVEYSRAELEKKIQYFETWTAERHMRFVNGQGNNEWEAELDEVIEIGKIPAIYITRAEPIWEDESENVYEAEWALSRNGNYIRKNARPNWVVFSDEKVDRGKDIHKDNDGSAFLQYPSDAKAGYQTWNQAIDSLKFHIDTIKQNFFMQLQLPDLSYENMKTQAMSGESRKMMFIDAQQKALDESGIWEEAFDREINVVRAFMKKAYPSLASAIDSLQVEATIVPFQINDNAERISNLSNATGGKPIMSQRTAVQELALVDDIDEELRLIEEESAGAMDAFMQQATE